jgi:hypothetical protein
LKKKKKKKKKKKRNILKEEEEEKYLEEEEEEEEGIPVKRRNTSKKVQVMREHTHTSLGHAFLQQHYGAYDGEREIGGGGSDLAVIYFSRIARPDSEVGLR